MSVRSDRSKPLVSAATLAASLCLAATAAHAEQLQDVIAYVYETNPGLQSQRAALKALDESYVQARSQFGPNISASAGDTDYIDKRSGVTAHADTQSAAMSLVQPLYSGGRLTSRLDAAKAQIKSGREVLRRYELDLLGRVVTAYLDVRRDQQLLKISQDTVAALQRELSDTQARFKVHEVTLTDLSQARARLAQAQTSLISAQAQLGVSRAEFNGVVGQPPRDLAPPPNNLALPATPDQAFDAAEANNPQLQSARYTEESSRASIAEARAARLPTVTARLDWQRTPFAPYLPGIYDNVRSASVTLSQPIFTSGQISSQIRQAIETNNRDRLAIDDARMQVIQQVSSAWEQLAGLRKELSTSEDEVREDEVAYAGVREEQKVALRSTIEVLNAELELSNAQQSLVRIRAAEYIDRVQLLVAMGVLTPQMLSANVEAYDPAANLRKVRHSGETPLEWPVRIVDAVAKPPIGPEKPASLAELHPGGPPMPPLPKDANTPIMSIFSLSDAATIDAAEKRGPPPAKGAAAPPTPGAATPGTTTPGTATPGTAPPGTATPATAPPATAASPSSR